MSRAVEFEGTQKSLFSSLFPLKNGGIFELVLVIPAGLRPSHPLFRIPRGVIEL